MNILWMIEHAARELDVACAVKSVLEEKYGAKVTIKHFFCDLEEVIAYKEQPDLIAVPYFYSDLDFGVKELIKRFPDAGIFNLAWEEIFYKGHMDIKSPKGEYAFSKVVHHAWGEFYREYLIDSGVAEEQIRVNGNPSLQMNRSPYNSLYSSREEIAERFNLDSRDKWILVPDNYAWAFADNQLLQLKSSHGGNMEQMLGIRDYCRECLKEVLRWFNQLGKESGITVIYRPKPSVSMNEFRLFADYEVPGGIDNIHFIKDMDVKQWISVSDMVFSSFSTTLMDAAVASKPVFMLEPLPVPDFFVSDWHNFLQKIRSADELAEAVGKGKSRLNGALKSWVEDQMLSNGDPVMMLGDILYESAESNRREKGRRGSVNGKWMYSFILKEKVKNISRRRSKYSGDTVNDNLIESKTGKFRELIGRD